MDNNSVKWLLGQYRGYLLEIKGLHRQLVMARSSDACSSITLELDGRLEYCYSRLITIRSLLDYINDPILRQVLIYHYFDGYALEEVAELMYYSRRQIYRLHDKALDTLISAINI